MDIKAIVADFTHRLTELIEKDAVVRARASVLSAFGIDAPRRPGRPRKEQAMRVAAATAPKKARKKMPPQLCPVPGCKNKAAPVFGMVCAKHKDVPKAKIKKYREARKAKKLGLKAGKS
jgi:hypothetical protein